MSIGTEKSKRTRVQSGALSRRKGGTFERLVVKALQEAGIGCRRNTGQAGSARVQGCDIEDTDWWIECTHGARVDVAKKRAQAERDKAGCGDTRPIAIVWRVNRGPVQVTMRSSDLIEPCDADRRYAQRVMVTVSLIDWIQVEQRPPNTGLWRSV